jgi:peroxiredoxin Q/BCP
MKLAALVLLALCLSSTALAQGPGAGDPAPAFALPGSDGKTHSLASFAGKRGVVLAWFPKAFTGG